MSRDRAFVKNPADVAHSRQAGRPEAARRKAKPPPSTSWRKTLREKWLYQGTGFSRAVRTLEELGFSP
jgi:hypothetical protein